MEKEVEVVERGEIIEIDNTVKLTKPYIFEGTEYNEIELSRLENLTAKDMIDANRLYDRAGGFSIMPELSMGYALMIASRASKHPIEFYYGLPPRDALRVKNKITSFFYGQD